MSSKNGLCMRNRPTTHMIPKLFHFLSLSSLSLTQPGAVQEGLIQPAADGLPPVPGLPEPPWRRQPGEPQGSHTAGILPLRPGRTPGELHTHTAVEKDCVRCTRTSRLNTRTHMLSGQNSAGALSCIGRVRSYSAFLQTIRSYLAFI